VYVRIVVRKQKFGIEKYENGSFRSGIMFFSFFFLQICVFLPKNFKKERNALLKEENNEISLLKEGNNNFRLDIS